MRAKAHIGKWNAGFRAVNRGSDAAQYWPKSMYNEIARIEIGNLDMRDSTPVVIASGIWVTNR
jgi:hypothetical protein